jgi:hypothetical protein
MVMNVLNLPGSISSKAKLISPVLMTRESISAAVLPGAALQVNVAACEGGLVKRVDSGHCSRELDIVTKLSLSGAPVLVFLILALKLWLAVSFSLGMTLAL